MIAFLEQKVTVQYPHDRSEKPGAVFVSMGTAARLEEADIRGLAANLAQLNRPVLWKIGSSELPGRWHLIYTPYSLRDRDCPDPHALPEELVLP